MQKISEGLIWASLVAVGLLIAPVFVNFMIASKMLWVLVTAVLVVGLFLYQSSVKKMITLTHHPLTLPLFLFGLTTGISTFVASNYPVENLLGWGGMYLAFVVIALLGSSILPKDSGERFSKVLTGLVTLLTVTTLLQMVGFGPSRLINALFAANMPHTGVFNLSGSAFIAAQIFGVSLAALGVSGLYRRRFETVDLVGVAMAVLGLAATVYLILPGKEATPLLLPFAASWSIALDTLDNFRAALIGIGPEYYTAAYSQFRPLWTNGQAWWSILFSQGTNLPLTLVVTTGLLGLGSWIYLLVTLIATGLKRTALENPAAVMAVAIALLQIVFPANVVLMAFQAIAIAVWLASERTPHNVFTVHFLQMQVMTQNKQNTNIGRFIGLGLVAVVVLGGFYSIGKAYAASYSYYQGNVALANNDAVRGYENQQSAVVMNPYLSQYRSGYALTNVGIALALSNKADLTEEEQAQVTQLVEQAIREARAATVLRPDVAANWQILAQIYRNLIGTAEGADQWTITSYVSAIERAPLDPTLRIELGGVFFQLEQYEQAANLFAQAAELKPDLVNAHYNLANALKQLNQLAAAEQSYQRTLRLLQPDSEDYVVASKELEEVQAQLAELEEQQAEAAAANGQGQAGQGQRALPSITEQNLNQPAGETVTQPGTQDLQVEDNLAPVTSPAPAEAETEASPTP